MHIPGKNFARWVHFKITARFAPASVILCYHRIKNLTSDPQLLAVTPNHFFQHLEVIQEIGQLLSLPELVDETNQGKTIKHGIVITFDDGYADFFYEAIPILEKFSIPATVFISTNYIDANQYFWWDELQSIFLNNQELPSSFAIDLTGKTKVWSINNNEQDFAKDILSTQWDVTQNSEEFSRQSVYKELCHLFNNLSKSDRSNILEQIRAQTGIQPFSDPEYRVLSSREILNLSKNPLVNIGAHTASHRILSGQTIEEQLLEIQRSKRTIEAISGRQVVNFSYPFGNRASYTHETIEQVKKSGFQASCSNYESLVRKSTDVFQLPRYLVRDWDRETFRAHLTNWFNGNF